MNITFLITGVLAIAGLAVCLVVLPYVIKPLDKSVRDHITVGVYVILISYVSIYCVIRPLAAMLGDNIWL